VEPEDQHEEREEERMGDAGADERDDETTKRRENSKRIGTATCVGCPSSLGISFRRAIGFRSSWKALRGQFSLNSIVLSVEDW
jgi:hypothetical protein